MLIDTSSSIVLIDSFCIHQFLHHSLLVVNWFNGIGNNVLMALNAVTLNGVHAFDNGFIGAMSMAKYDVRDDEIVAGIPAKVLRKIIP